jgi:hypothetical protein
MPEPKRLRQIDPHQVLLRGLNSFSDRLRHFFRFAGTVADDSSTRISDHHQRRKRQVLAALHDFRHAVDRDHLVLQLVRARIEFLYDSWHCFKLSISSY